VIEAGARVSYGAAVDMSMSWDEDARVRMQRIPSFVRGVVTARIESYARERGYDSVTVELLDEVRRSMPVDFSRRRPFFLEEDA
jgi:light-independent protochlorophyllide reductase subunit B